MICPLNHADRTNFSQSFRNQQLKPFWPFLLPWKLQQWYFLDTNKIVSIINAAVSIEIWVFPKPFEFYEKIFCFDVVLLSAVYTHVCYQWKFISHPNTDFPDFLSFFVENKITLTVELLIYNTRYLLYTSFLLHSNKSVVTSRPWLL